MKLNPPALPGVSNYPILPEKIGICSYCGRPHAGLQLVTSAELAKILKMHPKAFITWANKKNIPRYKFSKKNVRYDLAMILELFRKPRTVRTRKEDI